MGVKRDFLAAGFGLDVLAVADELWDKLSGDELRALAVALPFSESAFQAVRPSSGWSSRVDLATWVNGRPGWEDGFDENGNWRWARAALTSARLDAVAFYCSLAAPNAVAAVLEEMLTLARRKLELLNRSNEVLQLVGVRGCVRARAVMLGRGAARGKRWRPW